MAIQRHYVSQQRHGDAGKQALHTLVSSDKVPALSMTSLRKTSYFVVSEMSAYRCAGLDFKTSLLPYIRDFKDPGRFEPDRMLAAS